MPFSLKKLGNCCGAQVIYQFPYSKKGLTEARKDDFRKILKNSGQHGITVAILAPNQRTACEKFLLDEGFEILYDGFYNFNTGHRLTMYVKNTRKEYMKAPCRRKTTKKT